MSKYIFCFSVSHYRIRASHCLLPGRRLSVQYVSSLPPAIQRILMETPSRCFCGNEHLPVWEQRSRDQHCPRQVTGAMAFIPACSLVICSSTMFGLNLTHKHQVASGGHLQNSSCPWAVAQSPLMLLRLAAPSHSTLPWSPRRPEGIRASNVPSTTFLLFVFYPCPAHNCPSLWAEKAPSPRSFLGSEKQLLCCLLWFR